VRSEEEKPPEVSGEGQLSPATKGISEPQKEDPSTGESWKRVMDAIEEKDAILASKLCYAEPIFTKDRLTLSFNGGHTIHAESVRKNIGKIRDHLRSSDFEHIRSIKTIDIVKQSKANHREKQSSELTPTEKKVLDSFSGRIIERRKVDV
jgi:hypothetical protein